jgi:trehalose-6-phosphate synthase
MRLWIVSNRLPITAARRSDEGWEFKKSSGGLVSALAGVQGEVEFNWIGWPGCQVEIDDQAAFESQLIAEHACYPVFLSEESANRYYNGFSNGYEMKIDGLGTKFIVRCGLFSITCLVKLSMRSKTG